MCPCVRLFVYLPIPYSIISDSIYVRGGGWRGVEVDMDVDVEVGWEVVWSAR